MLPHCQTKCTSTCSGPAPVSKPRYRCCAHVSHWLADDAVHPAGVEHLLRDVKDSTISTLATEVGRMVTGLKGLKARLLEVEQYLQLVLAGKLPVNHDIMYQLQARIDGREPSHLQLLAGTVARCKRDFWQTKFCLQQSVALMINCDEVSSTASLVSTLVRDASRTIAAAHVLRMPG